MRCPSEEIVKPCNRLVVARMVGMQLLDPPARAQIPKRWSSVGPLGHRALDSHEQILDRLAMDR